MSIFHGSIVLDSSAYVDPEVAHKAALVVAANAADNDDARLLLEMLGLK